MERANLTEARLKKCWSQEEAAEAIGVDHITLYRWEAGKSTPRGYNLRKLCEVYGITAAELGFEGKKKDGRLKVPDTNLLALEPFQQLPTQIAKQQDLLFPTSDAIAQETIRAMQEPGSQDMDPLRRQMLQQILGVASASTIAQNTLLISDIIERLSQALVRPFCIDEQTLRYLEIRIENYWKNRNDVVLPARYLLAYVIEDLHKIIGLLEGSLLPTARFRLCSIAGSASMLVGELYFDMSNYAQARAFHEVAIIAAHEANNAALEAVAWARKSFTWTYDGYAEQARSCMQEARHLAWSVNSTIRAWLAAVEAEIQANLGEREICLKALDESTLVEDHQHPPVDSYWIHFDRSLSAGYQGVSFLRLSSRGHKDLIHNAQTALQDALGLLDPSMKRRQPTLLVDLAGTYVQQRNIEQACAYALQAINVATQIKSQVSLQRLLILRGDLEPWKETQYVKELDKRIAPLLTTGRRQGAG